MLKARAEHKAMDSVWRDRRVCLLLGEANTGSTCSLIKDSVDRLEEDVSKNREPNTSVGLNTTETLSARDGSEVDVGARHHKGGSAYHHGEVGQSRAAGKDVPALAGRVGRSRYTLVVCLHDRRGEIEKSGACVGNCRSDACRDCSASANCISSSGKAPKSIRAVHSHVGDCPSVLGCVDIAKCVGARSALLEVRSEELGLESCLDGVEERGLLHGLDSVDIGESETKQAIVGGILLEGRGDRGSCLDGLTSCSDAPDNNLVGVDLATCSGSITVSDGPSVSRLDSRRAVIGIVDRMAAALRSRLERGVNLLNESI